MPDGAPLTRDEAMISCCGPVPLDRAAAARMDAALAERFATELPDGGRRIDFLSPDIHCAACVKRLERAVGAAPGVSAARVNLSLRRIGVEYDPAGTDASRIAAAIADAGYAAKPFDAAALDDFRADRAGRELLSCMAAAGFAAANVMLLSVSVWTGAEDATRDLMHWISALIALPAIAYAGRPFFRSALAALSAGRLNMDVPISLAVILAAGVSLFETAASGPHAYFDADDAALLPADRALSRPPGARARPLRGGRTRRALGDLGHADQPGDRRARGGPDRGDRAGRSDRGGRRRAPAGRRPDRVR
ncbi:MAG: cation transporter, partial [Pseudomonadota bacterium]